MRTKSTRKNATYYAFFYLLVFGLSFSSLAQCPTITDPTPPPICDASGFTFNDLNAFATDGGNGIVWYDSPSGGSLFNPTELVTEGIYYADDNSGTCGARASITIDFLLNDTGQNLDQVYCSNENATVQTYIDDVLQAIIPIGGSVEIYYDVDLTSLANPTDTITVGATNYYIVFVDNGGCKSQLELAQLGVFSAPTDPNPTSPQAFCSDDNPTIGDLDTGTTATNFSWYTSLDGSGDPVPPALSLSTALIDGNSYYLQINDVFCDSNPVEVIVNIDIPVDPGTPGNLEYCDDSLPASDFDLFNELGGTPDTTGTWSGPISTSNGHNGTVNISTLTTAGTYTFTYTVTSNGVCPDGISNVTIQVFETLSSGIPSPLNPVSFCEAGLPSAFDLFSLIENHDLGGQWTQGTSSSDPIVTSTIDLSSFTPNTYNFTYTQNLSPNPCPEESTTIQIIVLQDPNAGVALNDAFCENDLISNSPYNLFDALDGSQDNNSGTWTDVTNTSVSNPIDITSFTVAGSPYLFTYTIDNGTCSDSEQISIIIEDAPESGTPITTFPEYCEGSAPSSFDLFDLLEGEDQTGQWFVGIDNTGSTTSNLIDLSVLTPNTYNFTFDVDLIGSCDDELVTVQVTINPLPNTGIVNNPSPFCENDLAANSPLNLFGQLTGEDTGGTWTDDDTSGALTGSDVDLTQLTIGNYNFTYTITDTNNCTNSSTVTIIVEDAPESGTSVTAFPEYCEGSAPSSFDLFDLLESEDQAGQWYVGIDNTGSTSSNLIDLSVLTPNTYSFTFDVDAIGICDDELVTVQVIINPLPNTGIVNNPSPFCENDLATNSPLDLFGQLTGEDTGGTWADDDTSGALTGSDVDLTQLTIGNYNFTYTITDVNSCTNSSTVRITVVDAPESGTANAPIEFCAADIMTGQTYNLFDLLTDEDQTGTWIDDDASGALSGNIVALDALIPATYNFTFDVDAIGVCDDANVTVSIIINDTPAPTATTPQEFCDTATVSDLVATGTTIQWYDALTGGNLLSDTTALVDGQTYYATQTDATTNCESSVRTAVMATIYQTPNAGDPNTTIIVSCNNNTSIDLFTGLDGTQDSGGTWNNDDGVGNLSGNLFDATGVSAGTYSFIYMVTASAPCLDDSETITVTIEEPLSAGSNINPTLDICSNNGTEDLFTLLGGADTGGSWSPTLASGTGVFDPLVDADGTYTYTLTNSCGTFTNQVITTVTLAPNAGSDASTGICAGDMPIDLFTLLGSGAQSGGTWSPVLDSGTGMFDPTVDASGTYTYTVTAVSPCSPDSMASITVTVNDSPPIIVLEANPEFCLVDNPTVADLSSSIRPTGTVNWYEDAALTLPLTVTDVLVDGEDYYATQTNSTGCESSISVQINVTVNDTPTPTIDDAMIEYCINDNPTIRTLSDNIVEYDSTADNLRWYDVQTGGSALSETTLLTNITYYVALFDAVTGCESSIRLEVIPDLTACGKVSLPDGFSPNGDGINDTYDIDNLDILYPNFVLEIYNRNGHIVYKGNANTPRFDGTSNQGRIVAKGDLPVGVYFYIFRFNDGENKPEQGRLYLSR
ncbi:gliding motility-associated C-terminal domain-containing protein [uncultured Algibacter sp.]|uniref:gliding motility-associated C-terminal domain-containing protein n=1 Tax=uncultured Algibacter sp. TaxID=298659 RepID=UPI002601F03F|nr:gliding motility-associated C-terminal domain-containing protein [uncultured Algibacter sp.]